MDQRFRMLKVPYDTLQATIYHSIVSLFTTNVTFFTIVTVFETRIYFEDEQMITYCSTTKSVNLIV